MSKINNKRIIAYLDKKWNKGKICPMCGTNEWVVAPNIVELREFDGVHSILGGQVNVLPIIPVSCKNCGNVLFVSATISGMIPDNEDVK